MSWGWITARWSSLLLVAASAFGVYVAIVVFTRLAGLRAFSKMSSFDFAITVAFGTILGSTLLTRDPPLVQGIVGLGVLYLVQYLVSLLRRPPVHLSRLVDNEPLLLMDGSEILHENLEEGRMTEADLRAKLREANVRRWEDVQAVVMETTGDVSVLHGEGDRDGADLDRSLLAGVRGSERSRRFDAEPEGREGRLGSA